MVGSRKAYSYLRPNTVSKQLLKLYSLNDNQNSDLDLMINLLLSLFTPLLDGLLM